MIKLAITKGRIEKEFYSLLKQSGFDVEPIENKERKLWITTKDNIQMIFVKSNDVLTFVEQGIVDVGIVGKDTLEESRKEDYNELLDLKIGNCYFALAGFPEDTNKRVLYKKKIATKYPNITKKYFTNKQEEVEIIKMEGSIELGPILKMTDAIVDIVQTGETLKANGLTVIEKISEVSTRLITNKVSLKYKSDEIDSFVDRLREQIKRRKEIC